MKKNLVINHPDYDPSFPESFNWGLVDSYKLSKLTNQLAKDARTQTLLIQAQRHLLPGLRSALNRIAEIANY